MPTVNVITKAILEKAAERGPAKTTCPSEIVRAVFPCDWRNHMQEIRDAAYELQKTRKVNILQKGKPVTSRPVKGPIRIGIILI